MTKVGPFGLFCNTLVSPADLERLDLQPVVPNGRLTRTVLLESQQQPHDLSGLQEQGDGGTLLPRKGRPVEREGNRPPLVESASLKEVSEGCDSVAR